ncbi:hypothetical protein ACHAXS_003387 [Conticribra weissflogii]
MADEQSNDFFNPPAGDDFNAFAAPPSDENIGDVYYNNAPDEQTGDFFNPPPSDPQTGDFFNPPSDPQFSSDGPIILGAPSGGYDAPPEVAPPAGVENVADDDDADPAADPSSSMIPVEQSPMAKWNEQWQQTLLSRKDEENVTKASHVEKAREEIAAFQAEREKKREMRMAKNRSDEQDKLEAIEADLENDNSWQKVVKMVELNQDGSSGAVDTGRMKDLLVLLKNEPARADVLTA